MLSFLNRQKKALLSISLTAAIIGVFLLLGLIYERNVLNNTWKKYPPTGKMITIDNRLMHVNIKGEQHADKGTFIILTGAGSWSHEWDTVQNMLSKHAQVVSYDRAGYGWSEPAPDQTQYKDQMIQDLRQIIKHENITGPIYLIGHSFGGHYARMYADLYPDDLNGMVLIEARHEDFTSFEAQAGQSTSESQLLNIWLAKFGIISLIGEQFLPDDLPNNVSREKWAKVHWDENFFSSLDKEMNDFPKLEEAVRKTKTLGNTPLLVISSAKSIEEVATSAMTESEVRNLKEAWLRLQEDLTNLSKDSKWVVTETSGHNIMHDEPELIVRSIIEYFNLYSNVNIHTLNEK